MTDFSVILAKVDRVTQCHFRGPPSAGFLVFRVVVLRCRCSARWVVTPNASGSTPAPRTQWGKRHRHKRQSCKGRVTAAPPKAPTSAPNWPRANRRQHIAGVSTCGLCGGGKQAS